MRALFPAALLLLSCSLWAQSAAAPQSTTAAPQGTAAGVANGTVVTMSYVGMFREGTVFASTCGEAEDFVIGVGRMLPALEKRIMGLKPGDSRLVEISAAELGVDPANPLAGRDIVVWVEIVSIRAAPQD